MKLTRVVWCFAIVAAVGILVLLLASPGHRRYARLPDGSLLVVEKVAYGKPERYQIVDWRERLTKLLPSSLANRFFKLTPRGTISTWRSIGTTHTNQDALYVYLTRRDATNGAYVNMSREHGSLQAMLVDEHGCEFMATQSGGESYGPLRTLLTTPRVADRSLGWYRFEAFPRHQREFRLRSYDLNGKLQAEFILSNPEFTPVMATNWVVESLPVTKSYGDVAFTLAGVAIVTNGGAMRSEFANLPKIMPKYEIMEGGQVSSNWQALDMDLYDSSGNFASEMMPKVRFLCPQESAWKLRVKFFGSEHSHSASNSVSMLRGLAVPAPGEFTALTGWQEFQGVYLKVVAFAGAGSFEYSNGIPVLVAPLAPEIKQSLVRPTWRGNQNYKVEAMTPHLLIEMGELTDDQRFTACATDDQGREVYAYQLLQYGPTAPPKGKPSEVNYLGRLDLLRIHGGDDVFLAFDLAADAKTIDVTFCVHSCYTQEFIFKPPTGMETSAPAADAASDPKRDTNRTVIFMGRSEEEGHIVHK